MWSKEEKGYSKIALWIPFEIPTIYIKMLYETNSQAANRTSDSSAYIVN